MSPGEPINEILQIISGAENITNFVLQHYLTTQERMDVCLDFVGPSVVATDRRIMQGAADMKKRGIKLRLITDITKDNIDHCKEIMKITEIRHLEGIRILTPMGNRIKERVENLNRVAEEFDIRSLGLQQTSKSLIIVTDGKFSLVIELKDDSMDSSLEAYGLASYSNTESTVWSYSSIFEKLWMQSADKK